jgi:hypothetical protein
MRTPKDKFAKCGVFFNAGKESFSSPQTASDSPRNHHRNTTKKHPFFQSPHQKTPVKPKGIGSTGA